jgi:hypothetical protein
VKGQRQENRKEEVLKIRELVRQEFSGKNEEPESISKNPSEPKMEIDWSDKESKKTTQKPKKIIFLEPDSEPVEEEEDDDF